MKFLDSRKEEQFRIELEEVSAALAEHPRFAEIFLALGIPRDNAVKLADVMN